MKKHKTRLITLTILISIATGIIHIVNKIVAASALLRDMLDQPGGNYYYNWRFGRIYYRKEGQGTPLILIHDLSVGGSAHEWDHVVHQLSKQYKVYTLDLLGCGRSDKPKITYTNFIYMQLIIDFVKNIIGEKTNVIASGSSGSFMVMACNTESDLFDKTILINPQSLVELNQIPNNNTKMQKFLLELPIIGTMIYHILVSRMNIQHLFMEEYFYNPFHLDKNYMDTYHEASYTDNSNGKYLYSSIIGRYTNFNIVHCLQSINNSICILGGKGQPGITDITEDYTHFNSAIESTFIEKAKKFPHIEQVNDFLEAVGIYLSSNE